MEEQKTKVKIAAGVFVCGREIREGIVFVMTDETWLADGGRKRKRKGRWKQCRRSEYSAGRAETFDGFDRIVVSAGIALGGLAVVCLEENVCKFVDACVTGVKSSKAADVINDRVEEVRLESV